MSEKELKMFDVDAQLDAVFGKDSIDKGAHILSMLRDPNVVKPVNPDNHYGEDQEDEE